MVAYCVSKAALLQLTRCAALELAAKGIRGKIIRFLSFINEQILQKF